MLAPGSGADEAIDELVPVYIEVKTTVTGRVGRPAQMLRVKQPDASETK